MVAEESFMTLPSDEDLTDDKSALVQVMAYVPSGNKPLPEPMFTHIYVTVWRH